MALKAVCEGECSLPQAMERYMAAKSISSADTGWGREILCRELSGGWMRACEAHHGRSKSEPKSELPARLAEELVATGVRAALERVKAKLDALAKVCGYLTPEQMAAVVETDPELPASGDEDNHFEFNDELYYHANDAEDPSDAL